MIALASSSKLLNILLEEACRFFSPELSSMRVSLSPIIESSNVLGKGSRPCASNNISRVTPLLGSMLSAILFMSMSEHGPEFFLLIILDIAEALTPQSSANLVRVRNSPFAASTNAESFSSSGALAKTREVIIMPEKSKRERKASADKTSQIYTQVRIDEATFLKGKILAAVYDESFNHLMVRAIRNEIKNYEALNGSLPEPATPEEK